MATRIGINGFGRIGRSVVRAWQNEGYGSVEIVATNDLTDPETLAYLLKFDSVHARFPGKLIAKDKASEVDGHTLRVTAEKEPSKIPWKEMGVDVVLECTGRFTDADKARAHLDGGARKV